MSRGVLNLGGAIALKKAGILLKIIRRERHEY